MTQEQLQPGFARNCSGAEFQAFLIKLRPDAEKLVTEKEFSCWGEVEEFLQKQEQLMRRQESGQINLPDRGQNILRIIETMRELLQHRQERNRIEEEATEKQQQQSHLQPDPPAAEDVEQLEEKDSPQITPWLAQARHNQKDYSKKKTSSVHENNKQFSKKNTRNGKNGKLKLCLQVPDIPKLKNLESARFASHSKQTHSKITHGNQRGDNCKRSGRLEGLLENEDDKFPLLRKSENRKKRKINNNNNNNNNNNFWASNEAFNSQQSQFRRNSTIENYQSQQQKFQARTNQENSNTFGGCLQEQTDPGLQNQTQNQRQSQGVFSMDNTTNADLEVKDMEIQFSVKQSMQSQPPIQIQDQFMQGISENLLSNDQQMNANSLEDNKQVVNLCSDEEEFELMQEGSESPQKNHAPKKIDLSVTEQMLGDVKCMYPESDGNEVSAIEIRAVDIAKLDPGVYTHDTVIEFYQRFVRSYLEAVALIRYHCFSTFFLTRLCQQTSTHQAQPHKMRKWLKNVDIFDKDFLLFPYNDSLHWSLFIVCYPKLLAQPDNGNCFIMHLDPIPEYHQVQDVTMELRKLLMHEYAYQCNHNQNSIPAQSSGIPLPDEYFNGQHIPFVRANVPAQDNAHDCGLFVCTYIEYFLRYLPKQDKILKFQDVKQKSVSARNKLQDVSNFPGFLQKTWFPPRNGELLRDYIRFLMLRTMSEQVDQSQFVGVGYEWIMGEIANFEKLPHKYLHPQELMMKVQLKSGQIDAGNDGSRRVTRQATRLTKLFGSPNLNSNGGGENSGFDLTPKTLLKNWGIGTSTEKQVSDKKKFYGFEEIEEDDDDFELTLAAEEVSVVSPDGKKAVVEQEKGDVQNLSDRNEDKQMAQNANVDAMDCVDLTDSQH